MVSTPTHAIESGNALGMATAVAYFGFLLVAGRYRAVMDKSTCFHRQLDMITPWRLTTNQ